MAFETQSQLELEEHRKNPILESEWNSHSRTGKSERLRLGKNTRLEKTSKPDNTTGMFDFKSPSNASITKSAYPSTNMKSRISKAMEDIDRGIVQSAFTKTKSLENLKKTIITLRELLENRDKVVIPVIDMAADEELPEMRRIKAIHNQINAMIGEYDSIYDSIGVFNEQKQRITYQTNLETKLEQQRLKLGTESTKKLSHDDCEEQFSKAIAQSAVFSLEVNRLHDLNIKVHFHNRS